MWKEDDLVSEILEGFREEMVRRHEFLLRGAGRVSALPPDAVVVWSRDRLDADAALKSIVKFRFAPAIAGGRTVNVTLTQRIAPL